MLIATVLAFASRLLIAVTILEPTVLDSSKAVNEISPHNLSIFTGVFSWIPHGQFIISEPGLQRFSQHTGSSGWERNKGSAFLQNLKSRSSNTSPTKMRPTVLVGLLSSTARLSARLGPNMCGVIYTTPST